MSELKVMLEDLQGLVVEASGPREFFVNGWHVFHLDYLKPKIRNSKHYAAAAKASGPWFYGESSRPSDPYPPSKGFKTWQEAYLDAATRSWGGKPKTMSKAAKLKNYEQMFRANDNKRGGRYRDIKF